MKSLKIAALAAAVFLTACSVPKEHITADPALTQIGQIALRAAIRHGVDDYLGRHGLEAATRVKAIADDLLVVLNSDAPTTLGGLKDLAFSKIPAELSPMDQQDARDLIEAVAVVIQQRISDGQLNGQAIVDLRDVLGTISYLAGTFAPK